MYRIWTGMNINKWTQKRWAVLKIFRNRDFQFKVTYRPKSEGIQDSLGFWTPRRDSGFQVLDSSLCQWNLDSGLELIVGFRNPWVIFQIPKPMTPDFTTKFSQILDSTSKHFGSFCVSVKLPTYPSPKPTLTLCSYLGKNVGLGEG